MAAHDDDDPEFVLAREVASRKRRAYAVVLVALVALPALAYGVVELWNRGYRLGLLGGLAAGALLTHRTVKRAMARRAA